MSVFSGPNVSDSGLVFAYDMYNTDKSWKGAPAVNLAAGVISVGNGNVPTTTVTDIKPDGTIGTVREHSAETISDPNRTVSCGSYNLTAGETYTISFYVKNINCTGFGGNLYSPTLLRSIDAITYPAIFTDRWARVVKTFVVPNEGPNPVQLSPQIFRDGGLGKFRLTDIQIEQNSFASPYINGTRSNTQALLDLTGKNSIVLDSLTYNSSNIFQFDGINNYVTFGNNSAISSIGGTASITVEAWVKYDSYVGNNGAQSYSVVTHKGTPWTWLMENPSNKGRIRFTIGGADVNCTDPDTHPLNTWMQWVGTYDGSNMRFYRNGVLKNTVAASGTLGSNSVAATVGQYAGQYRMDGQIPVVKIYNRALSAIEVQQNFAALRGRFGI